MLYTGLESLLHSPAKLSIFRDTKHWKVIQKESGELV